MLIFSESSKCRLCPVPASCDCQCYQQSRACSLHVQEKSKTFVQVSITDDLPCGPWVCLVNTPSLKPVVVKLCFVSSRHFVVLPTDVLNLPPLPALFQPHPSARYLLQRSSSALGPTPALHTGTNWLLAWPLSC